MSVCMVVERVVGYGGAGDEVVAPVNMGEEIGRI